MLRTSVAALLSEIVIIGRSSESSWRLSGRLATDVTAVSLMTVVPLANAFGVRLSGRLQLGLAGLLTAFLLTAIDETIWTTVPVGASFDQNLAILVGRPLAMVRARLQFQLQGAPYSDPSWPNTFSANDCSQLPPPSSPLTGYEFGIELGNIAQLDDGLIGYFIGDDYDQFNVVAESGAGSDGYLTPIGVDNNYLYQPFDGTTQTLVSMLIDPRAPVHATTAILPDASVAIPLNFASEAISKMNVTFRVNGLLTDQKLAPPPTPDGIIEPPAIHGSEFSTEANTALASENLRCSARTLPNR